MMCFNSLARKLLGVISPHNLSDCSSNTQVTSASKDGS